MDILLRILAPIGRAIKRIFNIGIPLKIMLILLILAVGGVYGWTSSSMMRAMGGKSDYNEAKRYIQIKDIVEDNFIDTVNRSAMGNSAAAAMISGLGDQWSSFMSADEYRTYQMSSANEYSGIGMSILKTPYGGFQITQVNPGSPAAWSGLGANMVIVGVDDVDVRGMDTDEVRTMIRSRLNKVFTLTIDGQKDPIKVDCSTTYVSPVSYKLDRTGAGIITISNFEAGSAEDSIAAIEALLSQNVSGFVLDLRDNPGGLVEEVHKLLDYLLPQGELFYLATKDGRQDVYTSDNQCLKTNFRIIINYHTYGEAEVFANVMQEFQWAALVGEATTGKTRAQQTIELADGSAIRLSTKSYRTAGGRDISREGGVVPDTIIYNTNAEAIDASINDGNGTASYNDDAQLREALRQLSMFS